MARNTEDLGGSRRKERVPIAAVVSVRRSGVHGFRVNVFNASPEGCKIEFIEKPRLGERIWVKFHGLQSLAARVRWLDGHIGGVQFEQPLHDAVFQQLILPSGSRD